MLPEIKTIAKERHSMTNRYRIQQGTLFIPVAKATTRAPLAQSQNILKQLSKKWNKPLLTRITNVYPGEYILWLPGDADRDFIDVLITNASQFYFTLLDLDPI